MAGGVGCQVIIVDQELNHANTFLETILKTSEGFEQRSDSMQLSV
jgi:hypothetical protein